ncbi:MAG: AzlD domain-containing protein [Elainella sp. Prado103]|jgi:branched-subunit amino acid transport protein|nr:AzlD domain-containing protein [Elainella sp. Prado103]
MNELWLISGMAVVTFAIRYPIVAMSGRLKMAPWFLQLLCYVPPTVLTAIVVPEVLMPNDVLWVDPTNARLIGLLAAIGVGYWRKNLLLTIVVGMIVFLGWQWLLAP